MPTVPGNKVAPFKSGPRPSEGDLLMALATMDKLGRIPKAEEVAPSPAPDAEVPPVIPTRASIGVSGGSR